MMEHKSPHDWRKVEEEAVHAGSQNLPSPAGVHGSHGRDEAAVPSEGALDGAARKAQPVVSGAAAGARNARKKKSIWCCWAVGKRRSGSAAEKNMSPIVARPIIAAEVGLRNDFEMEDFGAQGLDEEEEGEEDLELDGSCMVVGAGQPAQPITMMQTPQTPRFVVVPADASGIGDVSHKDTGGGAHAPNSGERDLLREGGADKPPHGPVTSLPAARVPQYPASQRQLLQQFVPTRESDGPPQAVVDAVVAASAASAAALAVDNEKDRQPTMMNGAGGGEWPILELDMDSTLYSPTYPAQASSSVGGGESIAAVEHLQTVAVPRLSLSSVLDTSGAGNEQSRSMTSRGVGQGNDFEPPLIKRGPAEEEEEEDVPRVPAPRPSAKLADVLESVEEDETDADEALDMSPGAHRSGGAAGQGVDKTVGSTVNSTAHQGASSASRQVGLQSSSLRNRLSMASNATSASQLLLGLSSLEDGNSGAHKVHAGSQGAGSNRHADAHASLGGSAAQIGGDLGSDDERHAVQGHPNIGEPVFEAPLLSKSSSGHSQAAENSGNQLDLVEPMAYAPIRPPRMPVWLEKPAHANTPEPSSAGSGTLSGEQEHARAAAGVTPARRIAQMIQDAGAANSDHAHKLVGDEPGAGSQEIKSRSPALASYSHGGTPASSTPASTPRLMVSQPYDSSAIPSHLERVLSDKGHLVECETIEKLILERVKVLEHCMLVTDQSSVEIGCIVTLTTESKGMKNTLSAAGLEHAKAHDSEAVTVMSARQCPAFRRGLAKCLEKINAALVDVRVQVRRFQILRESFTVQNGMLLPNGDLNRDLVYRRHSHIITDMYQKIRPNQPPNASPRSSRDPSPLRKGERGRSASPSQMRGRKRSVLAPVAGQDKARGAHDSLGNGSISGRSSRASSADPLEPEHMAIFGLSRGPGRSAGELRRGTAPAGSRGNSPTPSYSPYKGLSPSESFSELGKPFDLRSSREKAMDDELEGTLKDYFDMTSSRGDASARYSDRGGLQRASPPVPPRNRSNSPSRGITSAFGRRTPSPTPAPRSSSPRTSNLPWGFGMRKSLRGQKAQHQFLPRSHDIEDSMSSTPWTHGETKVQRGTYMPSTTLNRESTRPFDAENVLAEGSVAPAGSNTVMGLPVGGANFSPLIGGCLPHAPDHDMPRPNSTAGKTTPALSKDEHIGVTQTARVESASDQPRPTSRKRSVLRVENYGGRKEDKGGASWEF